MDIIKAINLKKYYTSDTYEVRALDGVSLTVEDGEFIAVVGTSGCGKTTLMNILGGLDTPDFGGVWIRNTSLKDLNKEERTIFRRRNIGFVCGACRTGKEKQCSSTGRGTENRGRKTGDSR